MNTIDNNRKGKIILVDMFDKYKRIDIKIIEKSQVFTSHACKSCSFSILSCECFVTMVSRKKIWRLKLQCKSPNWRHVFGSKNVPSHFAFIDSFLGSF